MRKIRIISSLLAMSAFVCSCATKPSTDTNTVSIPSTARLALVEKATVPPPGAIFYDAFDNGYNTPWSFYQGTHQFSNGVLKLSCATNAGEYSYVRTNWTNISVQTDVKLYPNSFGAGVGVRYNVTNGANYSMWLYPSNNTFTIEKYSKWYTKTVVAAMSVANVNATNIHNLKLSITNNTIVANLDNTYGILYTDSSSSPLVSGGISLSIWGGTTADFDNVTVYNLNASPVTNIPPKIQSITSRVIGIQGSDFVVSATVAGTSPKYQWYFGGSTNGIVGATNSSYTVKNVQTRNAGVYTLVVSNDVGGVSSFANASVFTTNILPQCVSTTNTDGLSTVTLAWCPSVSTNVIAAYKVYYGSTNSPVINWTPTIYDTNQPPCPGVILTNGTNPFATYTNVVNAGTATNVSISNLISGLTYYFAVTAVDSFGLESDYSPEVSYTVPFAQPPVLTNISSNIYWLASLACPAIQTKVCPFQSITYQYKTNLNQVGWLTLTNILADQYGNAVYDDIGVRGQPQRFYRLSTP